MSWRQAPTYVSCPGHQDDRTVMEGAFSRAETALRRSPPSRRCCTEATGSRFCSGSHPDTAAGATATVRGQTAPPGAAPQQGFATHGGGGLFSPPQTCSSCSECGQSSGPEWQPFGCSGVSSEFEASGRPGGWSEVFAGDARSGSDWEGA